MSPCPTCGATFTGAPAFCSQCATPLSAPSSAPSEERKIVTALFCDLVGFTAMSESADPEDVHRMLTDYSDMTRSVIQQFGGTVEKFIGDAVVGLFGVPVAHEDDPERAVRAGLRITERAEELTAVDGGPLSVRVGINTGEVLVRLRVAASSGERMLAGDAINVASRIEALAPPMGVAVGLATYEATASVFNYDELEPAHSKGSARSLRMFHAKSPLARFGTGLPRTHDSPLVGRDAELAMLTGIFDLTAETRSVHWVTVAGEPGLGKSRIVAELFHHVDSLPELVTWRQGRCLPYGDGNSFWALGEIVKSHAGILDSDGPSSAIAKLDLVLPDDDQRPWLRQQLLPLLGVEAGGPAERDQQFTAWRRFLEHIAAHGPVVLAFEDVHWADTPMLEFIGHLVDSALPVPLLVIATARPEFFDARADELARMRPSTALSLAPLTDEETAAIAAALLSTQVLPPELSRPILTSAGGNPLYAEELVRLLRDKDLIVASGSTWELRPGAQVPVPHSVQALIAARLDSLDEQTKSLLADAAVLGNVFWDGAVAAMSGRGVSVVEGALTEVAHRRLVRPARQTSMADEVEYSFWHGLTRDVAYSQIPRSSRIARHVAAAGWIRRKGVGRIEDVADVIANHYMTALGLARATGDNDMASDLGGLALTFLMLAGDRALHLDTAAALSSFEQALTLTPPGHPGRAAALSRFGEAASHSARHADAVAALEEAISDFRAKGDVPAAAAAMCRLDVSLAKLGDSRAWSLTAEAVALLDPLPPGPELVDALGGLAGDEALQGLHDSAIGHADRALAIASQLGLATPAAALGNRGMARASLGDPAGLIDYRDAITVASAAGQGRAVAMLHNNYGLHLWLFEGPQAGLVELRSGSADAMAHGLTETVDGMASTSVSLLFDGGLLDETLAVTDDLARKFEASGDMADLTEVRAGQTRIHTLQGRPDRAAGWLDWLETMSDDSGDAQIIVIGLASAAYARAGLDDPAAARALLARVCATPRTRETYYFAPWLPTMVRTAVAVDAIDLAELLTDQVERRHPYTANAVVATSAALAEAKGDVREAALDYADAATRWGEFGVVPEAAFALLGLGRCLVALDERSRASVALEQARSIFHGLRAAPALAQADQLLVACGRPLT